MFVHFRFSYFLSRVFLSLVMCSVRLVICFRFVYDILTFRSRVVLAYHVFPFLRLSLCFVIGSLSCVSVFAFVSLFCDWLFVMCLVRV